MQAFTTSHKDPLTAAAAGILFSEDVSAIEKKVKTLKVGDKTNFGIVKAIGDTWISFKGKDLGVTKIAFNQRKMGSKDYVLDQLRGMNEEVELDEATLPKEITAYAKSVGVDIAVATVIFKGMKEVYDKVKLDQAEQIVSVKHAIDAYKKVKWKNESVNEGVAEKMMKLKVGDKTNFGIVKEITSSSISFKNSSAGTTKIPFGATKVKNAKTGDAGFVLDDLKLEGVELEEGISFDAIAKAGKSGMSAAKIDSFVRIHKANGRTDKEINAMLLSGKGLKEEAELDEAPNTGNHPLLQKVDNALAILDNSFAFNGQVAKMVKDEIGAGYAADFKKMEKHLDGIQEIWDDIRMALDMPTN